MITIDGNNLDLNQIIAVSKQYENVSLSNHSINKINESRRMVESIIEKQKIVYGINTGFGIFSQKLISTTDSHILNRNLILSHAIGVGEPLPKEVVRAAILIRANTLAKGFSGVRFELINTLLQLLNKDITPIIQSQGSLGSSGDLCLLAQLALIVSKDENDKDEESGMAEYQGNKYSGKAAMDKAGISRIILGSKEGLALINGATFSAALAAISIWEALRSISIASLALALSLEAIMGRSAAFDARIHAVRGYKGQIELAEIVRKLIEKSTLINGQNQVQDPYSFRCSPQIHGAIIDSIEYVKNQINMEINAATDNPLIFGSDVLSGGNFHGEPVAISMDLLKIALTELSAISERRIYLLIDEHMNNGLPAMLVDPATQSGLNSGLMIPQYTAASLVLENRTLSSPDSVQSLPTSANQEDHNANAMTAARHAYQVIKNTQYVLTIELYLATRAIDFRLQQFPEAKLGDGTKRIYEQIHSVIKYLPGDALWGREINVLYNALWENDILKYF